MVVISVLKDFRKYMIHVPVNEVRIPGTPGSHFRSMHNMSARRGVWGYFTLLLTVTLTVE